MFKKRFISLLVLLMTAVSGAWATDSHWPDFNGSYYSGQEVLVAAIQIDGVTITSEYEGWDALEIAFFVGDECRGNGNYLFNGYVVEYGDPFPIIDGAPIFYYNADEQVSVKMYDHINGILYEDCVVTLQGEPLTILTGENHDEGWYDPDNPVFLNFTSPEPAEPAAYTVTLKEGTDDAANWQGKAGEGKYQELPLEGVFAGTAVSVKYSGTKHVKSVKAVKKAPAPAAKAAAEATAEDKGKLIGTDGNIYADVAAATAAGTTAVAKIIYIGTTGHATYSHGLALALTDEGHMTWEAAMTACNTTKNTNTPVTDATWLLASKDQWNYMRGTNGAGSASALRTGFEDVSGTNMVADEYWSSTEDEDDCMFVLDFNMGFWNSCDKSGKRYVRACLAF